MCVAKDVLILGSEQPVQHLLFFLI